MEKSATLLFAMGLVKCRIDGVVVKKREKRVKILWKRQFVKYVFTKNFFTKYVFSKFGAKNHIFTHQRQSIKNVENAFLKSRQQSKKSFSTWSQMRCKWENTGFSEDFSQELHSMMKNGGKAVY